MKKILTILGARPQFIKASVVSRAIAQATGLSEIVVHTGQHFDANMSDVFFAELGMKKPEYQLDIHGGHHGEMTGRMLVEIEKVLLQEKPDIVLVYGDTNSTLAGALAAVKLHIPIAHVEAGLRSFNMAMPEEINRILTDRVSRWLFTPTTLAAENLQREGILSDHIVPVGDVMYDVALHYAKLAGELSCCSSVNQLELRKGSYIFATIHRAENTDDIQRLQVIIDALKNVASDLAVVWPLHPRTKKILQQHNLIADLSQHVTLIEPQGYLDVTRLEQNAAVIVTDSGGIQKEAFFHQVPCVTLRDETEWNELLQLGWNRLAVPTNAQQVAAVIRQAIGTQGQQAFPYGDGNAALKIANTLATTVIE